MAQFNCAILLRLLYLCFSCVTITYSHLIEEKTVTNKTSKSKIVVKSQRFKKYDTTTFDVTKTGQWTYLSQTITSTAYGCAGNCIDEPDCTGFFFNSFATDGLTTNCFLNDKTLRSDQRKYNENLAYFEVAVCNLLTFFSLNLLVHINYYLGLGLRLFHKILMFYCLIVYHNVVVFFRITVLRTLDYVTMALVYQTWQAYRTHVSALQIQVVLIVKWKSLQRQRYLPTKVGIYTE